MYRPGLSTLVSCVLCGYAMAYFLVRLWRTRKPVSLALVAICPGWAFVAAILNGHLPRSWVEPLRWVSVFAALLVVAAILKQGEREKYRGNRRLGNGELERRRRAAGRRVDDRRGLE